MELGNAGGVRKEIRQWDHPWGRKNPEDWTIPWRKLLSLIPDILIGIVDMFISLISVVIKSKLISLQSMNIQIF